MQATEALCNLSVTDIKKTFCNIWFSCKNEACVNCGTLNATNLIWLLWGDNAGTAHSLKPALISRKLFFHALMMSFMECPQIQRSICLLWANVYVNWKTNFAPSPLKLKAESPHHIRCCKTTTVQKTRSNPGHWVQ